MVEAPTVAEKIKKSLENPHAAFAFLLGSLSSALQNDFTEAVKEKDTDDSQVLKDYYSAIRSLDAIVTLISMFTEGDEYLQGSLIEKIQEIIENTIAEIEARADLLVYEMLDSESDENKLEASAIVETAKNLFEIQELNRQWLAAQALSKKREDQ